MSTVDIKVPEAGESITEGVLLEWHVADGGYAKVDDPLFELETDKITMTVVAEAAGQLAIDVPAGERVEMGQVVARLDTSAEAPAPAPVAAKAEIAAPADAPAAEPTPATKAPPSTPAPSSPPPAEPVAAPSASGNGVALDDRLLETLSPSVRRMIVENHVDASRISGTGRGGRITKQDVINFLKGRGQAAPAAGGAAGERVTRKPMSSLRRRIAQRLVQSQQTAAILTTFNEADMSAVMALRSQYKESFEKKHGVRLGFMSFFVKAVVEALQAVPALNAQIDGDDIVQNHFYDIGVAVGTEHGLVVPVVRDCDEKTFAEIEIEIGELAKRARNRKLELRDLEGGCFTVSNGGVYGSMLSTPILNPPQSGILGLHAIKKRPIEVNNEVAIRPMMYLAMSYDHRLVDGTEAVTFLKRIKECIEAPDRMLLDI